MNRKDDEKIFQLLKEYDRLHFCLTIILYYQRNHHKAAEIEQMISEGPGRLCQDLPPGIIKLLDQYEFAKKVRQMDGEKLRDILKRKYDLLGEEVRSAFSLWKILFRQFAELSFENRELIPELFSALSIASAADLKNTLYVSGNFHEVSLTELLYILVQLRNYQKIHILNYDEGDIDVDKCLADVREDLSVMFYGQADILESLMDRLVIVREAQLNFAYLDTYVAQNAADNFIIVIGMERFVQLKDGGKTSIRSGEGGLHLRTSENMDWYSLLDEINNLYVLIDGNMEGDTEGSAACRENCYDNAFLLTVYRVTEPGDNERRDIYRHYNKNTLSFDLLFDGNSAAFFEADREKDLYEELLELVFCEEYALEKILEYERRLSEESFIVLKAYFYLAHKAYYFAIEELEKLPEDTDLYYKYILADLYNVTGDTDAAYGMLESIYERDRYFPSIVDAALYSLRDDEDQVKRLMWIRRGLSVDQNDPAMIQHLANFYTEQGDYRASAGQWEILHGMTGDLFYQLLSKINIFLCSVDTLKMKDMEEWVSGTVSAYPQYADEIYARAGSIISDKKNREHALPYFEKVAESFEEVYCVSAVKKMELYCRIYSRLADKSPRQQEMEQFVKMLSDHVIILTYSAQSVYSWSDYIRKIYSYEKWVEISERMLMCSLTELVRAYLAGEAEETHLAGDEEKYKEPDKYFEKYGAFRTPDREALTEGEYLLFLLMHGKAEISKGDIQSANNIAYTLFNLAASAKENYYKNVGMCFGLLLWSGASMAIGACAEGILSFIAAAKRLSEIGEAAVLYRGEFVFDQLLYLYSRSFQAEPEMMDVHLFERYFEAFGYPGWLLYCMSGRYGEVIAREPAPFREMIDQMEEANIMLMQREENLHNLITFDSLILSYDKLGETERAGVYVCRLLPVMNTTFEAHIDIAHRFFMRYADILAGRKEYDAANEMLKCSLAVLERLRGVSFSRERGYLGDMADTIIRGILCNICEKNADEKADLETDEGYACGGSDAEAEVFNTGGSGVEAEALYTGGSDAEAEAFYTGRSEMEADELFGRMVIELVPRAIIEERNGRRGTASDETLLRREREYYQLFDLLNGTEQRTMSSLFYRQIVERFLETKRYLEEHDPQFRALEPYTLIGYDGGDPFVFLRGKLKKGEAFYRNILVDGLLIHILIRSDSHSICFERIDTDKLGGLLARLEAEIGKEVPDLVKSDACTYIGLFEELTELLFAPLIGQADQISALYYMPDHKLPHITPNFVRIGDKWGVECFDRIELVIDYNHIGDSRKAADGMPERFFVSASKRGGIGAIRETMDGFPAFTELVQNGDGQIVIEEPLRTLVVAAHGISDESGKLYDRDRRAKPGINCGAKKLELSRKKQIDLNEFIILRNAWIENAIVIACGGGTPAHDKIELNNGVWDAMLRKNVKYILYCKWDVSTSHTNELLAMVLQVISSGEKLLSDALNSAQRKLAHLNPVLWAGLEVWKNG